MKLRNVITKEICDAEAREDGIYIKANWSDEEKWFYYDLETLARGWEYYTEPAEPLIKDEKIRKAVRAWAEACDVERAYLRLENEKGSTFCVYTFQFNCNFIQIATHDQDPIEGGRTYAITELCGEEGE